MSNSNQYYEVLVELVIGRSGHRRTAVFRANDVTDAVESAVRFARRMHANELIVLTECPDAEEYKGLGPDDITIGAVQVSTMHHGPIRSDGSPSSVRGLTYLFEWKCDYPASLHDYVEDFRARRLRSITEKKED